MSATTQLTNSIIDYLNLCGCLVWRNSAAHVYGRGAFHKVKHNGVGDIVGLTATGRHIEVEVKVGADKVRPEQQKHGDEVRRRGGIYIIARDFDSFERDWKTITSTPQVAARTSGRE